MRTGRNIVELAANPPRFDVASVKEVEWRQGAGASRTEPGRIDYRQIFIKTLVLKAYGLAGYQVVWPAWVEHTQSATYDISATFPPGTTTEQLHLMLQELLADRFKLSFHRETRDTKVYALQISDGGLKIHKAANPPADDDSSFSSGVFEDRLWHVTRSLPGAPATVPSGLRISTFTEVFNDRSLFDRILVDRTGLEGFYDIDLKLPPGDKTIFPERGAVPDIPELLSGMEKQLGLKAEKKTLPIEIMVIDHLEETPTPD